MIDERTEILINRKLDGELTDEESLELNKLLIRNPDAHALLDAYAVLDGEAGEAIRAVVCEPVGRVNAEQVSQWTTKKRQWWYSMGLISAVAAALTLAVLLSPQAASLAPSTPAVSDPGTPAGNGIFADKQSPETVANAAQPGGLVRVGTIPFDGHQVKTETLDRDVIGVWDQNSRSLYLLEANDARSTVESVKFNY